MPSHFNNPRTAHPHETFLFFGGLLLLFNLGRLLIGTAERFGTDASAWSTVAIASECALILYMIARATARQAGPAQVLVLTTILVTCHVLIFGLIQLAKPSAPQILTDVSMIGHVLYYCSAASVAYGLACVMVYRSRRETLLSAIAPGALIAAGVWAIPGEVPTENRVLWAIGSAIGMAASGWFIFLLSHVPVVRAVFANRPPHHLDTELMNAKRVHESLFPEPFAGEALRFGYAYLPMRQIGGDYIHVYPHGSDEPGESRADQSFYLTVIDVTGHGISSALTVNRLNAELQQFFSNNADPCPSAVMSHLNDYVVVTMADHGLFATAVCARVDPARGTITVANAGHPPCFFRSASELRPVQSEGPMLGVFPGAAFVSEPVSFGFDPGDRLIVFTDGAFEARSKAGEMLGAERLHSLVEKSCQQSVAPARDPLAESLLRRKQPGRLLDRADVRKPTGLIQQVLRNRMNAHPCALADEIMLSISDFVEEESQDDILIATIELLQAKTGQVATAETKVSQPSEVPQELQV